MRTELEELIKKFETRIKVANDMEQSTFFDAVKIMSEFAIIELKLILANNKEL
jgi:hypothetical protein